MYKIAVVGEKDSIIGFSALGFDVFPITKENAHTEFRRISSEKDYAIIYLTETFYLDLKHDIDKFKESVTPAVILIPGAEGSLGYGATALDDSVERAIGANIL